MKKKWLNIILSLIIIILIILLIYSISNIIKWQSDSKNITTEINNIQKSVIVEEIEDTENTEIIQSEKEIPKENPYWDYINMNMINVNFTDLKKINSDVRGWIKVNGTNINYPFVQTTNNSYYLNHSFNKSANNAGWVFLDYRNNGTNNRNTIIYAHGRTDKTMFGSLKNILTSGWLNNNNNYIVKISAENENTLWQVFSIYHIPTTNDYLQTEFQSDESFLKFANILKERSSYNFDTTISKTDNILTLSTCYNNAEKLVLHAKLIKKENK